LKRKKERRKHRPKLSGTNDDKPQENGTENDAMDVEPVAKEMSNPPSSEKPKRPKKRPRHEGQEETEDVEMELDTLQADVPLPTRMSPTPELLDALPSFPLPALPDAPSKSLLALQGLDQALLDAELVSPSTVLPIPTGKDDGGTKLSEKMRKRLRDIGVVELFAGE
jgi:ATP-dependent RNA helicase DDX51/DBP6